MSKLERWAHVAEIASAIAVVVSLLYVGYELRRGSIVAAVDTSQQLAQMSQELSILQAQSDMAAIVITAEADFESLDPVELSRFTELVRSSFNLWEHAYYSYSEGVLPERMWSMWNASYCREQPVSWFKAFEGYGSEKGFLPGFLDLQKACYVQKKMGNPK